jgi:integrase
LRNARSRRTSQRSDVRHDGYVARRRRRGEGTVFYSHADRRWIAKWPLGVRNGKRLEKRIKCRTERQALAELERMRRAYGAGGDPATKTLDAYLADWIRAHGRSVAPSTRVSYEGHIRNHISPLLGGIPVARIIPADVRRLIDELERNGLSPATIGRVVTTLHIALQAAVDERAIPDNATSGVRLPKVERSPVRALTEDDADRIRAAVKGHWTEHIVRVLLGSGIRLGEAIGLDQGDLLLDVGFVRVRNSKTDVRAVPVSDDAVDALRTALAWAKRRGVNEPVFFAPKSGDRMLGSSVSHAFPRLLERAGLDTLTPHGLRHGAASLMLYAGHPMRVIAEQLGHRNPAITARVYAHVVPAAQRAAVSALEPRKRTVGER